MTASDTEARTGATRHGAATAAAAAEKGVVCVIDLGQHSKKRVRRLRRGGGKLMERVEEAVGALHEDGVLAAGAQTVVVVVRQKSSGGLFDGG